MDENIDLFTKIFLDTDSEKGEVIEIISKIGYGTISGSYFSTEQADIYIFNNGNFDQDRRNLGNDKFLYYRYCIEIKAAENVENNAFVLEVTNLLIKLWDAGYKAIASCDFEEFLPRKEEDTISRKDFELVIVKHQWIYCMYFQKIFYIRNVEVKLFFSSIFCGLSDFENDSQKYGL